jgi:hypothetical protein
MAELLFNMRTKDLTNTMLITDDNKQIPVDFIKEVINEPNYVIDFKTKLRYTIQEIVLCEPDKFRDEDYKYHYIPELYDYSYKLDEYIQEKFIEIQNKTIFICSHCNSDNVRINAWVKPNINNQFVCEVNENNLGWCEDCEHHSIIDTISLKHDAKIIGFQVVGKDGSNVEGEVHPLIGGINCVYSLNQARTILNDNLYNNKHWRLLTVWDGDIENPKMMFEGNPRN